MATGQDPRLQAQAPGPGPGASGCMLGNLVPPKSRRHIRLTFGRWGLVDEPKTFTANQSAAKTLQPDLTHQTPPAALHTTHHIPQAHTHAHTRTPTHTHAHARPHTNIHMLTHTETHAHKRTRTHAQVSHTNHTRHIRSTIREPAGAPVLGSGPTACRQLGRPPPKKIMCI